MSMNNMEELQNVAFMREQIRLMGPKVEHEVAAAKQAICDTLSKHGFPGLLALSLVGAEINALGDKALKN